MLYFKVKTGFGPNDYIPITQEDYGKAVRAQVTGKVAIWQNGETTSGSSIQGIIRDYSRSLGYKPEYQVSLDEVPKKLIEKYDELHKQIGEDTKKLT